MIKKLLYIPVSVLVLVASLAIPFVGFFEMPVAQAAFNPQINYQGRLTTPANIAVTNGDYDIVFKLYTVPTGGVAIWTESDTVQVTDGLFSIMLGSTTSLTSIDFNQVLYLGVTIEADSEMTPRKILGAVPAAMIAKDAGTLGGVSGSAFFRNDQSNSTSSASTFMSIIQTGAGKVAEFFGASTSSVFSITSSGNVGVGTSTPTHRLTVRSTGSGSDKHFATFNSADVERFSVADDGIALFTGAGGQARIVPNIGVYSYSFRSQNGSSFIHVDGGAMNLYDGNGTIALNLTDRLSSKLNGKLFLGGSVTTPSALLHLATGTASASTAPLKFSPGTNLTSAEAGAVEYDGTQLYFSPANTDRNILLQNSSATAFSSGIIPFASTNGYLSSDAANFIWDDTNDRLGIGTSTPIARLQITGAGGASPFLIASSTNAKMFEINQSGAALFNNQAGTLGQVLLSQGSTAAPIWVATSSLGIGGTATSSQWINNGANIYFNTGNVGIGTSTPATPLYVVGTTSIYGALSMKYPITNAVVIGDTSGNARGTSSIDIQSSHGDPTWVASGVNAIAFGADNQASRVQTIAIGFANSVDCEQCASFGRDNALTGGGVETEQFVVGLSNSSTKANAVTFGLGNSNNGSGGSIFGSSNLNEAADVFIVGISNSANAFSADSTLIGRGNIASSSDAVLIGRDNLAEAGGSVLYGNANTSSGSNGLIFGYNNIVSAADATIIGQNINNSIANSIQIGSSDSAKITISSTGNLGVGTTTPLARLQVTGVGGSNPFLVSSSTNTKMFEINQSGAVAFNNQNGTLGQVLLSQGSTAAPLWTSTSSLGFFTTNVAEGSNLYYTDQRVSNYILGSTTLPASINYWTKTVNDLSYTAGKVGVGTSTPLNTFQVRGTGGTNPFRVSSSTNASLFEILQNGNVGIGTMSPSGRLHVSGGIAGDGLFVIDSDTDNNDENDNPGISLLQDGSLTTGYFGFVGSALTTSAGDVVTGAQNNALVIGTVAGDSTFNDLQFMTGDGAGIGVVHMTINSSGNIGIGTTTPIAKLQLTGGGTASPFLISSSTNAKMFEINRSGAALFNNQAGTLGQVLLSQGSTAAPVWTSTSSLGFTSSAITASLTSGFMPRWTGSAFTDSILRENGSVVGINASSSSYTFNLQGTGGVNPFNVSSSTGTSLFTILNNGNIGVGTSTPAANFTVAQSATGATSTRGIAFTGSSLSGVSSGSGFLFSLGYNAVNNKQIWFADPDGAGNASFNFARMVIGGAGSLPTLDAVTGDGASRAKLQLGVAGDTNSGIYVGTLLGVNGYAAIGTGYYNQTPPTNGLIVQGNVGIGTTTPQQKLDIANGSIVLDYNNPIKYRRPSDFAQVNVFQLNGNYGVDLFSGTSQPSGTAFGKAFSFFSSGATELMTITGNGLVGIGTSSPIARLHVSGAGASSPFLISSSTNVKMFEINQSGAVAFNNQNGTLGQVLLSQGSTAAPVWTSTSTLGFLTTNVAEGTNLYYTNQRVSDYVLGSTTLPASINYWTLGSGNVYRATGKVGVGTTTPWAALTVAGITDSTSYYSGGQLFGLATTTGNLFLGGATPVAAGVSGAYNFFVGNQSGFSNTSGNDNIFVGNQSGFSNVGGSDNIFLGSNAGTGNVSGGNNLFLGNSAGSGSTGSNNVFLGTGAGSSNAGGLVNVYIGNHAGSQNNGGSANVAIGYLSGQGSGTGNSANTLVGYQSGGALTSGSNNIMLGYRVGTTSTTGANNILIGSVLARSASDSNFLNIGNALFGDLSTGNIGLSTTTPIARLQVTGAGTASPFLISSSTNTKMFEINQSGAVLFNNDAGTSGFILRSFGSTAAPQWVATSSLGFASVASSSQWITNGSDIYYNTGKVAVGTSTPLTTFQVTGVGGTNPFRVSSSTNAVMLQLLQNGNFGIGSSSPIEKLSVAGNGYFAGNISAEGVLNVLGSGTSTFYSDVFVNAGRDLYVGDWQTGGGKIVLTGLSAGPTPPRRGGAIEWRHGTSISDALQGYTYTNASGQLVFSSTTQSSGTSIGTSYISFIDGGAYFSGNVGLGTTTPLARLQITGGGANNPFLVSSSTHTKMFEINQSGAVAFNNQNGTLGQVLLSQGSTAAPLWTSTSSLGFLTTNVAEGSNLYYTDQRVSNYILGSTTLPASINYWTKTVNDLSYTAGKVGVGTSTPLTTLQVTGVGGTNPFRIASSTNTVLFEVQQNGNVGIGSNDIPSANGGAKLYVRGTGASTASWRGRIVAGGDNVAFLMGEYNSQAWLGGHSAALNAWADLYIQPDGASSVFIGDSTSNGSADSPVLSVLNSSGSVGVGTSSPASIFSVVGTTTVFGALSVSHPGSSGAIIMGDTSGAARGARSIDIQSRRTAHNQVASGPESIIIGQYNSATSTLGNSIAIGGSNNVGGGIYNAALGSFNIVNGRSGPIDGYSTAIGNSNTINVGYGTAVGSFNTVSAANSLVFGNFIVNDVASSLMIGPTATVKLTMLTGGNSGFGTTSPLARLQITGAGGSSPFLVSSSTNTKMFEINQSGATLFNDSAGTLGQVLLSQGSTAAPLWVATSSLGFANIASSSQWITNGSDIYYNTGKVAVGTSTPLTTFQVTGVGGTNPFRIASSTNVSLLEILQNGNVGINTVNPSSKLTVTGNVGIINPSSSNPDLAFTTGGSSVTIAGSKTIIDIGGDYDISGALIGVKSTPVGVSFIFGPTSVVSYYGNPTGGQVNYGLYMVGENHNYLSGRLGIGSSTPSGQLAIRGSSTAPTVPLVDIASSTGASIFRINANGHVGIATPIPTSELQIGTVAEGNLTVDVGSGVDAQATFSWTTDPRISFNTNSNNWGTGVIGGGIRLGVSGLYSYLVSAGGNLIINPTAGNVGIGTTTPISRLQVTGSGTVTPFLISSSTNTKMFEINQSGATLFNNNAGTLGQVLLSQGSTAAPVWTSTSSLGIPGLSKWTQTGNDIYYMTGNVGIGTTTPTSLLTVAGTSMMRDILPSAPYSGNMSAYNLGATGARWNSVWAGTYNVGTTTWSISATGPDRFGIFDAASAGGNEYFSILQNGMVGIGSSTPLATLSIEGLNASDVSSSDAPEALRVLGGSGTDAGGGVTIIGGEGGNGGTGGGVITIRSGAGTGSNSFGGNLVLAAGSASGAASTVGGSLSITAGSAGSTGTGGAVTITAGDAGTSGTAGNVTINPGLKAGVEYANVLLAALGGRVGIGTTTPVAQLNVKGISSAPTTPLFEVASSTNNSIFRINSNGNVGVGITNGTANLSIENPNDNTDSFAIYSGGTERFSMQVSAASTDTASFFVRNNNVMTLNEDTLVGIGTTTPAAKLQVTGSAGTNPFRIASSTNTVMLQLLQNGNFGVGVANPTTKVSLGSDTANTKLAIYDDGTSTMGLGAQSGQFRFNLYTSANNRYSFMDAPAGNEIFTILGTGKVGVGTTTPLTKFQVTGSAGSSPFRVSSSTNSSMFEILQNGYVGIGNSNPAKILTINDSGGLATMRIERTGQVNNLQADFAIQTPGGVQHFQIDVTDGASTAKTLSLNPSGGLVGVGTSSPATSLQVRGIGGTNPFRISSSTNVSLLEINQAGNVGIGTTSPLVKLDVNGGIHTNNGIIINTTGNNTTAAPGTLQIYGTNNKLRMTYPGVVDTDFVINSSGHLTITGMNNVGIGTTTPIARLQITGAAGATPLFEISSSTNHAPGKPSGTLMRVLSTGQVAIGTSTPFKGAALTIERNNADASGNSYRALGFNNTSSFLFHGGYTMDIISDASGVVQNMASDPTYDSNGIITSITCQHGGRSCSSLEVINGELRYNQRMTAALGGYLGAVLTISNGAVSIGSTTPGATFSVRGTSTRPTKIIFDVASSSGATLLRVNADGNIGIGTTSPLARLHITGIPGANSTFRISSSSNETVLEVAPNGFVGIGTSTPAYMLSVGNASTTGVIARFQNTNGTCDVDPTSSALSCTSDQRLKKNIATLSTSSSLEKLRNLRSVSFNWLAENDAAERHPGFIAQEVEAVFPDLVNTNPDGYKSLAYSSFAPYLVQGIQELDMKVTTLEQLIASTSAMLSSVSIFDRIQATLGVFTKVQTSELCLDDVCINKDQLRALLNQTGGSTPPPSNPGNGGGDEPPPDDGNASSTPPVEDETPSDEPPPEDTSADETPSEDTPADSGSEQETPPVEEPPVTEPTP